MANLCDFFMKIRGTEADCRKWLEQMKDHQSEKHFYRMDDIYVSEAEGTEKEYHMVLHGLCAWSLETCCRVSGYAKGTDLFAVHTAELNILMEAWGEETGMGFQEHYIYKKGECILEECKDYEEFFWDRKEYPTYAELKKEIPDAPDESAFVEDVAGVGGIENYGEWSIDRMFPTDRKEGGG